MTAVGMPFEFSDASIRDLTHDNAKALVRLARTIASARTCSQNGRSQVPKTVVYLAREILREMDDRRNARSGRAAPKRAGGGSP